jgi:hypothetical protein
LRSFRVEPRRLHHTYTTEPLPHFIMVSTVEAGDLKFNGSNWQALNRIVALARFQFLQDEDYDGNDARKCAYLASRFDGPALDWAATVSATSASMSDFEAFIVATRSAFGIADNNITALLRRDLDQLQWSPDVPVFFSEFDRLTLALGITSHETRVAMVESKLPTAMKIRLAEQALSFSNYDTMRERFNCMWALDPSRGGATGSGKRPRCGTCGKKGHQASQCRGSSGGSKN